VVAEDTAVGQVGGHAAGVQGAVVAHQPPRTALTHLASLVQHEAWRLALAAHTDDRNAHLHGLDAPHHLRAPAPHQSAHQAAQTHSGAEAGLTVLHGGLARGAGGGVGGEVGDRVAEDAVGLGGAGDAVGYEVAAELAVGRGEVGVEEGVVGTLDVADKLDVKIVILVLGDAAHELVVDGEVECCVGLVIVARQRRQQKDAVLAYGSHELPWHSPPCRQASVCLAEEGGVAGYIGHELPGVHHQQT